ncbi:hypothetical protein [Micromonospora siamensis]|uniref:TIR domain-containing protein n=1 Tax=Micromonospora siamensis TaxID=299152 RepID=A0A1C5GN16_9ACTN|nr:hypothetical protein [Micromonospora siamensis]SCG35123.1 hypothetical protein GA0074704_0177 [Micromonospora siamensis]
MNGTPRQTFKTSVFLSYPKPCREQQQGFIDRLCGYLDERGFAARTLGVTDYDMDAPLKAIRRLMRESNGLITVAFRRTYVDHAVANYLTDVTGRRSYDLSDVWLTSPWAHIEPAMAYQLGLPILILRESKVVADGLLERGVVGTYMPEFDVEDPTEEYLASPEWRQLIGQWEAQVRTVVDRKGDPPQLY